MLETIIVVLILLWALGLLGAPLIVGSSIHILIAIVLVLVIIRLAQSRNWFNK